MPKLKASLGRITIASPMGTNFVGWLKQEVVNFYEWNPKLGEWADADTFVTQLFRIEFKRNSIVVTSAEPRVWLRSGLCINMGHGRIEVS